MTDIPNDDEKSTVDDEDLVNAGGLEVCAFDNRGMGRSSVPSQRSEYTTTIMAKDAIALMDHLGWRKAHVFGHSMGGMIACKLAALVPDRILSLALLNVTGGGFQCLPKLDRLTLSVAVRFLLAKTPEERAAVDLDTHYSQDYLDEHVGQSTRRETLYQQYVKGISKTGMQSNHGFEGQINACWTHKMTLEEIKQILSAGFLISIIHGRQDIVAQMSHAKRLAGQLYPLAKMVELHGGHLVSHERTDEVNEALLELIKASESKISPQDWTNLSDKTSSDWIGTWNMMNFTKTMTRSSSLASLYKVLERLNRCLIYLFGVFVLVFEYLRRVVGKLKPVRVGSPLTY